MQSGIPDQKKEHEYGFTLVTPDRVWLFGAQSDEDRDAWTAAINSVIDKPPAPQDYSVNLRNELRNSYSYKRSTRGSGSSGRNSGSGSSIWHDTIRKGSKILSSPFS